jgi:hypothetical protein
VIDFRYHLVSIIAVFLALGIGLVVGANELPGVTEAALKVAAHTVTQDNKSLTSQKAMLKQEVTVDQGFAQAAEDRLIGGLLTGQRVVLVTAPGFDSQMASQLITVVQRAGASVTGQVTLQPQFFNSSDGAEEKLAQLAQSLAPAAGVTVSNQPASNPVWAQQEAAQLIAAAVVAKDNSDALGLTSTQSQQVLSGFGQSGYLTVTNHSNGSSTSLATATMAIVVAPATPPTTNDASPANLALIAMVEQLQPSSSGTVLAGTAAGSAAGSAIDEISGAGKITTVDNADVTVGQVVTVQALAKLLAGHAPASYGVGPGTVPDPAPTPSPSPATTTPSPSHVRKK